MQYVLLVWSFLLVGPLALAAAPPNLRTWTSRDGNYVVRAELVDVLSDKVRLRKPDGSIVSVPISRLSAADVDFLATRVPPKKMREGSPPDPEKAAQLALEQLGLRITGSGLSLADEPKFSKMLRDVMDLRKNLKSAELALLQQEKQATDLRQQISRLTALDVNLNAQLANLRPGDATMNNKLIGAINANRSQVELLRNSLLQQEEVIKVARGAANEAREAFIQAILNMRTMAERLSQQYARLSASEEAKRALQQWNAASQKSLTLAESRNFRQMLKRLESLEETILSEEIPLRRVGGGSLVVSVVIDGKHTQEMVLDSGANLVTLPQEVANQCGIQIGADDPRIVMGLADGSRISGRLVTIGSVRVGKFTAQNVACAVLGAEAANAPSLLGMSFLEHFKFQVDAANGTLTMVQIREEEENAGTSE
ncbi:MAG: TIGR02281 family clan AA aspartic protease [Pirellulaceae bacterium]